MPEEVQEASAATTCSMKGSQVEQTFPQTGKLPKNGTPATAVEVYSVSKQCSESLSDLQQKSIQQNSFILALTYPYRFIRSMSGSPKFYLRLNGLRIYP